MVINLRVKTLDSQDHEFSVEDDVSHDIIDKIFVVVFVRCVIEKL